MIPADRFERTQVPGQPYKLMPTFNPPTLTATPSYHTLAVAHNRQTAETLMQPSLALTPRRAHLAHGCCRVQRCLSCTPPASARRSMLNVSFSAPSGNQGDEAQWNTRARRFQKVALTPLTVVLVLMVRVCEIFVQQRRLRTRPRMQFIRALSS